MTRPYLRGPNTAFSHWPKPMPHELIKIEVTVTINMVDNRKLDDLIALIKSQAASEKDLNRLASDLEKQTAETDQAQTEIEQSK